MNTTPRDAPVLVAGGGIGGLAAALALVNRGFEVKVLEQAAELGEIGAGIQLGPNAFAAFDALGRLLVNVEFIGIANLLLDEPMYPEFIQGRATPAALAAELRACLESPNRREQTRILAEQLRALLGQPASTSAAGWLERQLRS